MSKRKPEASAQAKPSADNHPVDALRRYVGAFNRGDVRGMAAACAPNLSILDGMAPHVWYGPTATEDWHRDVLKEGEHLGASGYLVTLGEPLRVDVTGNSAYAVISASMTFQLRGTQVRQTGATMTAAFRMFPEGWRLTGWAWSKGKQ